MPSAPAWGTVDGYRPRHAGFSAAARDLGVTPSAISKLVTRLERRLGVRLLQRSRRGLALTAEGEIYFDRAQRITSDIADAESADMRFGCRTPRRIWRSTTV